MKQHARDGFQVFAFESADFERYKAAVASLDKGRSQDTQETLEDLQRRYPDYHALQHYVLGGLFAKGEDRRGIALFRSLQEKDGLGHRFARCERFVHREGGPMPEELPALVAVTGEGEHGAKLWEDYVYSWKLGKGSRIYELRPESGAVVLEGLVKRHVGEDETIVVELEWGDGRERIRFNGQYVILGSTSETVRARVAERFTAFRVVVQDGSLRLYVDGVSALHAKAPAGPVKVLRFGCRTGTQGIDTNVFWSSMRVCFAPRGPAAAEVTPFPHYEQHLGNLAVARLELGQRRAAFDLMVAALETNPTDAVLANFQRLVEVMAEDLDLADARLQKALAIVAERLDEEAATHLRAVIQQKRRAVAVSCENVSIYFSRAPHRMSHPLEVAKRLLDRKAYFEKNYWWAVRDVSFEVRYGEVLAIVGNNGAGKSTLLRAIAGILDYRGTLVVNGNPRLLVMGLGIQEELSARDNIMLGCLYLGLRRRAILRQTQEILEFAELLEFADVPYKYYSDGMKARLMFSIATTVEPDILLLDELLGAGDVTFRQKAMERMNRLLASSKAIVAVTHNLTFVREKARKAVYMEKGRVLFYGDPNRAVDLYLQRGTVEAPAGADTYLMEEV